jgi:outer membrane protein OmpA-like peptidoglycan-associated protein
MNPNLLFGGLSFLVWSAFSTWYYVNHIKEFEAEKIAPIVEVKKIENVAPVEKIVTVDSVEAIKEKPLTPIDISRNFTFNKNAVSLIDPSGFETFVTELKEITKEREIRIKIVGHTCDRGRVEYNMDLGEKRARIVAKTLKEANDKLGNATTESRGESEPLVPNTNEENRMKNRRVTITITSQP